MAQSKVKTEKEQLEHEMEQAQALESLYLTPGGQELVKALTTDVMGLVDQLGAGYQTLSHAQLMALCADMKAKTDLMHTLTRAADNKNYIKDMLKNAMTES